MKKPSIDTIVWDLDNTPWDWVSYAAKTYPAMRDHLARRTGESRVRVTDCMRRFYERAGTIESSWLVQDLENQGLVRLNEVERERLICSVRATFHACRQKYLRLFHGFPQLFEQAVGNGVRNLIHTDAPATHAASRVRHLKLDQDLFSGMIAMPDSLPSEIPTRFLKADEKRNYGLKFPVMVADAEKPDTDIERLFGVSAQEIHEHWAFAGDHYGKDMGMAHRFKALGFHALWSRPTQADLAIVREFSGARVANRNAVLDKSGAEFPTVVPVAKPSDIARHLQWR